MDETRRSYTAHRIPATIKLLILMLAWFRVQMESVMKQLHLWIVTNVECSYTCIFFSQTQSVFPNILFSVSHL